MMGIEPNLACQPRVDQPMSIAIVASLPDFRKAAATNCLARSIDTLATSTMAPATRWEMRVHIPFEGMNVSPKNSVENLLNEA